MGRKDWKDWVFPVIVNQLKGEQAIPSIEHKLAILSNFTVYFWVTCPALLSFLPKIPMMYLYIGTMIHLVTCIGMFILSSLLYHKLTFSDSTPLLLLLQARVLLLFKKFSFPLAVYSFTKMAINEPASPLLLIFGIISFILGGAVAASVILFMFNNLPSRAFTACLDNSNDLFLYFGFKLAVIISALSDLDKSYGFQVAIGAVSCFFCNLQAVHSAFYPKFWNPTSNLLLLSLAIGLAVANSWSFFLLVCNMLGSLKMALGVILVLLPVSGRFSGNLHRRLRLCNPFDPSLSTHLKRQAIWTLETLFAKKRSGGLRGQDLSDYNYYRTVVKDQLAVTPDCPHTLHELEQSGRLLHRFLVDYVERQKESCWAQFSLLLQLCNLFDSMPTLPLTLAKIKSIHQPSLQTRLRTYHILTLSQTLIESFYTIKIGGSQGGGEFSLEDLYFQVSTQSCQSPSPQFVDINMPMYCKNLLLTFNTQLRAHFEKHRDLMHYLQETITEGSKLSTNTLASLNGALLKSSRRLHRVVTDRIQDMRVPPLYFYPPVYLYHSLVTHQTSQAKKTLHQYRHTSAIWDILRNKQLSLRIDSLDPLALIVHISLQPGQIGKIIDSSPNFETLLGMPKNKQLIGNNINDIFVDCLSTRHQQLMQSVRGFESLVSSKREFFIKTFEGELKETIFILKLLPNSDGSITIVGSLSYIKKIQKFLLLTTPNLDVIQAEKAFWMGLDNSKSQNPLTNLTQISAKLGIMVSFLKSYRPVETYLKANKAKLRSIPSLQSFIQLMDHLLRLNNHDKLMYCADERSVFYRKLRNTPLSCKIHFFNFKEIELIKFYITFGSAELMAQLALRNSGEAKMASHLRMDSVNDWSYVNNSMSRVNNSDNGQIGEEELASFLQKDKFGHRDGDDDHPQSCDAIMMEVITSIRILEEDIMVFLPPEIKSSIEEMDRLAKEFESANSVAPKALKKMGSNMSEGILKKIRIANTFMVKNSPDYLYLPQQTLPESPLKESQKKIDFQKSIGTAENDEVNLNWMDSKHTGLRKTIDSMGIRDLYKTGPSNGDKLESINEKESFQSPIYQKFESTNINKSKENDESIVKSPLGITGEFVVEIPATRTQNKKSTVAKAPQGNFKLIVNQMLSSKRIEVKKDDAAKIPNKTRKMSVVSEVESIEGMIMRGVYQKSVDASTVASTSLSSEHKVNSSLEIKPREVFKFLPLFSILLYSSLFISTWIAFEVNKNKGLKQFNQLTTISVNFYSMSYHISASFCNYLDRASYALLSSQNKLLPSTEEVFNSTLGVENMQDYLTSNSITLNEESIKSIQKLTIQLQTDTDLSNNGMSYGIFGRDGWLDYSTTKSTGGYSAKLRSNFHQDHEFIDQLILNQNAILTKAIQTNSLDSLFKDSQFMAKNDMLASRAFDLLTDRFNSIKSLVSSFFDIDIRQSSEYNFKVSIAAESVSLAVVFGLVFWAILRMQPKLTSILSAYSVLSSEEVSHHLTLINFAIESFNGDEFDHKAKLAEIYYIRKGLKFSHEVFNDNKSLASSVQSKYSRNSRKSKGRGLNFRKGGFNRSSGITTMKMFKGTRSSLVFNTGILILIGLCIALKVIVNWAQSDMNLLGLFLLKDIGIALKIHLYISQVYNFSPIAIESIDLEVVKSKIVSIKETKYVEEFTEFWSEWRDQIKPLVGDKNILSEMVYQDYCSILETHHLSTPAELKACRAVNQGRATKGYLQLLSYENEIHKQFLIDLGAASKYLDTDIDRLYITLWQAEKYVSSRSAYNMLFDSYLEITMEYVLQELTSMSDSIKTLMSSLRGVGICVLLLPLFLVRIVYKSIKKEFEICYHTYRIILPETIINNKYVCSKFKKIYRLSVY